jgi:hypothetical protein
MCYFGIYLKTNEKIDGRWKDKYSIICIYEIVGLIILRIGLSACKLK